MKKDAQQDMFLEESGSKVLVLIKLLSAFAQFMVKSKLFFICVKRIGKITCVCAVGNQCEELQVFIKECSLLKLSAVTMNWLKASRMATPRFFNSICTRGKPLTRMVTS